MIIYGRNLSPFARRVAIWCALQGRSVERRSVLTFGPEFETLKDLSPVGRVPVVELDDGTRLIESYAICDWLDETTPNGVRLLPASGAARRDAYQRLAMASGTAEKAVALVYDKNRRPPEHHWPEWQERLQGQIRGGLAAIEAWVPTEGWSTPEGPDAGDVAAVIAHQFIEATNPWLLDPGYPGLAALSTRAMDLPAFAETKPEA
jgi:glutathione S-transferase